jgi:aryl carrier-like protein
MSWEDWQAALLPKVPAVWNIHEALKDHKIDFFVLFASSSGIIGQPGQANYSAGNTFNDAFVQYRQSLGMPASVLDIGAVEDIGYVSKNPQILESFRSTAVHMLSEKDLLESLHLMITRGLSSSPSKPTKAEPFCNIAQVTLGMRTELPLTDPTNRCRWKRDRRMAIYSNSSSTTASHRPIVDESLIRFMSAVSADPPSLKTQERIKFLVDQISQRVCDFLMIQDTELSSNVTLNNAGLDSLVAIELRNWWRQNLGSEISVLELLNGSLKQLGIIAAQRLQEKLEKSAKRKAGDVSDEKEVPFKTTWEQYTSMKAV